MTGAIEVKGRPYWARDEPAAVQRIVVDYRFTRDQLEALRGFAPGVTVRSLHGSIARALRQRKLGDLTGRRVAAGQGLTRTRPPAEFELNETGRALVEQLRATAGDAGGDVAQTSTPRLRVVSEPAMQTTARRRGLPYRD